MYYYETWEDYRSGMYRSVHKRLEKKYKKLAVEHLSNHLELFESMKIVIVEWPISSKENLHDETLNRQPWLGQAACCYKYQVPESITRLAWMEITEKQRKAANKVADMTLEIYDIDRKGWIQLCLFDNLELMF